MKKTLVIGASENDERYAYRAIHQLRKHGHEVVAIGAQKGKVADVDYDKELVSFSDIDTVTLYINPKLQTNYTDYILALRPKRILFNPGTENEALQQLANAKGIATENACTLVLLSTGQY